MTPEQRVEVDAAWAQFLAEYARLEPYSARMDRWVREIGQPALDGDPVAV